MQDILYFFNTEKKSFSKYKGEDKNLFRLAAILQYFDTGVCLTKIKNEKDAGGDIETHYTSYGAYKKANAKYIITKNANNEKVIIAHSLHSRAV